MSVHTAPNGDFEKAAPSFALKTWHIPGLPRIQMASAGRAVLRVRDTSRSTLFAYNEVTASQSPLGQVVFNGHTPGEVNDLRHNPAVFFPSTYRDYKLVWHPSVLGIGEAHLVAYVYYHPNPEKLLETTTSSDVLVISPWWIAVLAVFDLLVLLGVLRSTRRFAAGAGRRSGPLTGARRVLAWVITALVIVVSAFLAEPTIFFALALVGLVGALFTVAAARRRGAPARLLAYEAVASVIIVLGCVAVVLAGRAIWSPALCVGLLSAGALWGLFAWWSLWWGRSTIAQAA